MFIDTITSEILSYLELQDRFSNLKIGWPSDYNASGIDDIISEKGLARYIETTPPDIEQNQVAYISGNEVIDGVYYSIWSTRDKEPNEYEPDQVIPSTLANIYDEDGNLLSDEGQMEVFVVKRNNGEYEVQTRKLES